ncbi:MAG: hypothetical protein J6Y08_11225 [Clostridiales bacterium]|nr:hypothetical protein [Clostridiales bacterium]
MEIAFHCPNCLADLIYDESRKYTCCFCHTELTAKDEVTELEGGYYVGDAWNEKLYHEFHCEDCGSDFIMKAAAKHECPICSSAAVKDKGEMIGAMPRRAIPFVHTKQQAEEMFLDYIRNNSAVGRTLATDENKALLHKVYVPCWVFTYEVVAHARLTAMIRNKANEQKTIMGINAPDQLVELLSPIKSSFSRFQQNRKGAVKDPSSMPSEHITGGVLSWQGIPFDASGLLEDNLINSVQPYDQSKLVTLTDKLLMDAPVLSITKDPISCMQEFMERVKKWTRQMIMDAHSDSYDISFFSDKTDYPLGIGELVLFPIWYMRGEYMGREFYFAMNGQNGEVYGNIPMSKVSSKNVGITYQQYWDKSRCTALSDTHFEFNIHDPNIEILDYSFFEKPRDSRVTAEGRKKPAPQIEDLSQLEEEKPAAPKADAAKKPLSKLDVQISNLKPNGKKLTKEEEQQRAREMTARLRVAAKEKPKGDMSAASEAPSWAKAVTPPPSVANAGSRPVRTKKPAMDRPSTASSGNKPLWERDPDSEIKNNPAVAKKASMAEQIARASQGEVIDPEELRRQEQEAQQMQEAGGIVAEARKARPASTAIWDRQEPDFTELEMPRYPQIPDMPAFPQDTQASSAPSRDDSAVRKNPHFVDLKSREARAAEMAAAALKPSTTPFRTLHQEPEQPAHPSLVESADDVLMAARDEVNRMYEEAEASPYMEDYSSEGSYEEYPTESFEDQIEMPEYPIAEEIPMPEVKPEEIEPQEPQAEEPQRFDEVVENGDNEDMMATITFSFNKKNAQKRQEKNTMSGTSIPRRTDDQPAPERGMDIMNSEYDVGVLPSKEKNYEDEGSEPREITPSGLNATENYIGREENDRPLAYRPVAPLAKPRGDVYVEEVDTHPELDENNRPLATRPLAPLARVTDVQPSAEYIAENGMDDGIHQIPSIVSGSKGRWGEMPEATETPSWAKPQHSSDSPFAGSRDRRKRPSREELMAQDRDAQDKMERAMYQQQEEVQDRSSAFRRPGYDPDASRPQEQQRPAAGRPGARPGARPAADSSMKRETAARSNENVPIWERVPETDGPIPSWGAFAGASNDDRPRGSLMKPKDQIIDVEKPRERPSLLKNENDSREKLPSSTNQLAGEVREVMPRSQSSAGAREVPVRPQPHRPPNVEHKEPHRPPNINREPHRPPNINRPEPPVRASSLRPGASSGPSGIEVSMPTRRPAAPQQPEEQQQSPFAAERPRTFAQRRQMEDEERQRQAMSPFAAPQQEERRSPFVPNRNAYEEPARPEPEDDIPALARSAFDPMRSELAQNEAAAKRSMSGMPEFDPDGPSPFKPNR